MKQYLDFASGVLIGFIIGFMFGFAGMMWAVTEPIDCGNKCVEAQK